MTSAERSGAERSGFYRFRIRLRSGAEFVTEQDIPADSDAEDATQDDVASIMKDRMTPVANRAGSFGLIVDSTVNRVVGGHLIVPVEEVEWMSVHLNVAVMIDRG